MSSEGPADFLGRAIAAARSELGLKRMQLKERSGLSYPYIAEIENGGKYPSQKAIAALAGALETTPSELLRRAERLAATDQGGGHDVVASQHRAPAPGAGLVAGLADVGAGGGGSTGDEDLVDRLTEQVMSAVGPRIRDWLLMEVRMAVQEELQRERKGR